MEFRASVPAEAVEEQHRVARGVRLGPVRPQP
jgi:hypothetical protein